MVLFFVIIAILKQGQVTADLCLPWNYPYGSPSDIIACSWEQDRCVCRPKDIYGPKHHFDYGEYIIYAC